MASEAIAERYLERARELIGSTGGRATQPRLQVLAALLASDQALGHADLRERLPKMDRVSRYRSLEWLLEHNLGFRIDDAGHPRYGASHQEQNHQHPHFRCTECGMTTCLSDVANPVMRLPRGFRTTEIEILVKGLCQACADR